MLLNTSTRLVFKHESKDEDFQERAKSLADCLSVDPYFAMILISRGIVDEKQARAFLAPTLKNDLPDPSNIKGIQRAAEIVAEAVLEKKNITVFTDFDVDGLSSGAQLVLFLKQCGARVSSYTPNRFTEGYGLSADAVRKIAECGASLLVTVDCGISNKAEITLAKELGMKSVILDHHLPHEMPEADAVVDPAQEGCPFNPYGLAAAGLVFMFLIVLRRAFIEKGLTKVPNPKDFLDLAALGTICDMVPLQGPNRLIALRGLEALERTTRPGLQSLKDVCGVKPGKSFSSGHVGFMLGPRINAAGRVGEGKDVMELFTTPDSKKAKKLAKSMDKLNQKRQFLEREGLRVSLELLEDVESRSSIAVYHESFHLGVIGIIAQRLVEKHHKPTAVMGPSALDSEDPIIKGSVRSISAFHVADNLEKLEHLLLNFGGHAAAGGFSLKLSKLEEFGAAWEKLANSCLTEDDLAPKQKVDLEISLEHINFEFVSNLKSLEPFGVGNPSPVFYSDQLEVESVKQIGENHLKLLLSQQKKKIQAVAWKLAGHPLLVKGKTIRAAYSPEINNYGGVSTVQLNIKEVWTDSV